MLNSYYDRKRMAEAVERGDHRKVVGGLWDEMGQLQLDFLRRQGMGPEAVLLDVGCGTLRLGRLAVDYLKPGCYWGTDLSTVLLDAGYARELDDAGRARLPRQQLLTTEDFDFSGVRVAPGFAMAQSLFTHLPLNHLRRCLINLAPVMAPGGRFCVTYFECPDGHGLTEPLRHGGSSGGIVSTDHKDPFHYRPSDLEWAAREAPWRFERIGDWGHPRAQFMAVYVRLDG